jgi:5S rRNA maturation endonuclease (ribonuclease M5)
LNWPEYRNRILAEIDNEAFYMSELDNVIRRGSELKAECPFSELHENQSDDTPSFTVNLDKGVYYCHTCHSKGNVHTLYKTLYGLTSTEAWFELGDALNIPRPDTSEPFRPEIPTGLVGKFHQNLINQTGPLRDVLRKKRGLTDETLKRFQLGWDGERITIPIYDEYNRLVNFRRYKWNSNNDQWKVLNYEDELGNTYGEVRIFGIENLINDDIEEIIWCEGEMDRIILEQYSFPAACPTGGAGTWRNDWAKYFRNKKRVYILQDNDKAGKEATEKICHKLYRVTDPYVPKWPDDFLHKGDATDFFVKCGYTKEDLQKLLDNAEKFIHPNSSELTQTDTEAIAVHLADSANATLHGKKIKVPVMVSGKDNTPYICPKKIKYYCGDQADAENKRCQSCDLAFTGGLKLIELGAHNKDTLKLIKCSEKKQQEVLKHIAGINKNCPKCTITVEESMNLEEIRMIPKAEDSNVSKVHEYVVRLGYSISDDIKTNKRYTMVGYMWPDPHTQYATYIFDKAIPEKDFISEFEMTDEIYNQLKIFQVNKGQTIEDKFNEIHRDLERNITHIWERRDVAIAVDLIYHTVLNFYFQGQFVKRGWGELLIIGDSGQAKTTLVERLMSHYRLGEMYSGESSKRTGLVYNLQQNNKRWFLVWGAFPLNDGGLIAIDELSGIDEKELAIMSDVRSSGIAKATGVITAETNARTRAIYISNPRNGRPLNTETFGVEAVLKLFGKTEDVRRLDLAIAVASGDVNPALINRRISQLDDVQHVYTSDLCNLRALWAWSRRADNIRFTNECIQYILDAATKMGNKYSSSVPIVEAADQRMKIARLAVATACCMFSTEDGENVIVDKGHAEFVVSFMDRIYSSKSFAYDKLSERDKQNTDASADKLEKLRKEFILLPLPDHNEMARILYNLPYFNRYTLEDYSGLPKDELRALLKFLTTRHLIEKTRGDYRRYPLGTEFFASILNRPILTDELNKVRKEHYNTEY